MPEPTRRAKGNALLGAIRLALILSVTVLDYACFLMQKAFSPTQQRKLRAGAKWSHVWAAHVLRIMEVRLTVAGPPPQPGALITPNHFSWLDVLVLMAATPMFFVSRADVARWPIAGFFTRGIGTVFIKRSRAGRDLLDASAGIGERLRADLSVAVFLEGTTAPNHAMLPFRPSLVQAAIDSSAPVVPAAIKFTATKPGIDIDDDVGYWKQGQKFGTQAWRLMGLSGVRCTVLFGNPLASAGGERKELAEQIEKDVHSLFESAA